MERNKIITIAVASLTVFVVLYLNRKKFPVIFSRSFSRMNKRKDIDFISDIGEELLLRKRSRK